MNVNNKYFPALNNTIINSINMKVTTPFFIILLSFFTAAAQTELTDKNANSKLLVNNDRLIVLDFYATWCGPCKAMKPIVKTLQEQYGDQVDFYKIDVDDSVIDDALGISSIPTYIFIKNSSGLERIEGAMSKEHMEELIKKHMKATFSNVSSNTDSNEVDLKDFSQNNIDNLWNHSVNLNNIAWNAYKTENDITILLRCIKAIERSIELEKNYYNVDTHAALLYKTGNYTKALKRAKEAIDIAKKNNIEYETTTELIEKITRKM